jgi:adenine-specific DNA methylase
MTDQKSFIEVQFPVSKVSKESYKERKAGQSQTLTGLGKWWGRKPLILVRAAILGLLMPTSDDPIKDRDIFLKVLMMDNEGVWARKNKLMKDDVIIENLTYKELKKYYEIPVDLFTEGIEDQEKLFKQAVKQNISRLALKKGLSREDKEHVTKIAFDRLSYDDRLEYCLRPEETSLTNERIWVEINSHLGTKAHTLAELIQELGIYKYGKVPSIGDCFAGGGSIPFEAARMGLSVYASDLNPISGLLTWAGLNILSLTDQEIQSLKGFQEKVFDAVAEQIEQWGIEKNEKGWMAKYFLYCLETTCPHCLTKVPLAPSWIISKKMNTVALLRYNSSQNNFDIKIIQNATIDQFDEAEKLITIKGSNIWCPKCKNTTSIQVLRHDDVSPNGETIYGLRQWGESEFVPKPDDVFQDRLYAIKFLEKNNKKTWSQFLKKPAPATDATYGKVNYTAPDNNDLNREETVINLLKERFEHWQRKGYIPSTHIIPGDETTRLKRERGWNFWHQLFNPRQLLLNGLLLEYTEKFENELKEDVVSLLGLNKAADFNSKMSIWFYHGDKGENTFVNQALNTIYNYSSRGVAAIYSTLQFNLRNYPFKYSGKTELCDARTIDQMNDIWITDPPYADAVNYHELSEFFLAWDKKFLERIFPDWYTDSRRVLAVKGTGESFNKSMIEIYQNLADHMPGNGMQIVMFTHQNPAVWADLTLILWSAGLHVTAAWNIATETESGGLKEGNYVKGTVLLVLRKLTTESTAFTDEITFEIQEEVKHQIESMRNLEDKEDPNFSDADYLLAAYAATLKVLTSYKRIGDINVEYELSKARNGSTVNPVEIILINAIKEAYNYLIPQSFDSFIWKNLTPEERFFIKGMELEKSNVYQLGAYQEMARGFGVKEFKDMLASTKANQVRFKTPSELSNRWLGGSDAFGNSLLRHTLMAIYKSEKEENAQIGRTWLKNEVEDYWSKRTTIVELLRYLSTTEHIDHMGHWESPALFAKYLVELVSQDGV